MSSLVLTALLLQGVTAVAVTASARRAARAFRIATVGGAASLAVAVAGIAEASLADGERVGPVLVAFVLAVTLLVQAFARGNLRGDPAAGRFAALAAWLAVSAGAAASALDLVAIALAWSAGTAVVIALLGHAGAWGQARIARRRAAVALVIGDAGLWVAVAAVRLDAGTTSIDALGGVSATAAAIAGAGVALAALSRAAAVPFHGWLPASLAAPTPVSALLHAGFVNAGAVLLLRTAELPTPVAGIVAGAAGAVTVVVAGAAMLTRPDVKGRLVHSTAAQMGFMLLACAIGAWALAIFHVMAHGLFKAASFLGSGAVVPKPADAAPGDGVPGAAPTGVANRPARVVAVALAALAPVAVAALLGGTASASAALLLFTVLAVAVAASGALHARTGRGGAAWLLAAVAAATGVAYVLATRAFDAWLALDAPAGVVPWPIALAVAAALALVAVATGRRGPVATAAYAMALGWARPPLPPPAPIRSAASTVPSEYGSLR